MRGVEKDCALDDDSVSRVGTGGGNDTLKEGIDFDGSLGGRGEGTLGTLASSMTTTDGTRVSTMDLKTLCVR